MFKRAIVGGLFVFSALAAISASVVAAGSLTDRIDGRMTIIKTDPSTGRILCAEHQNWTTVAKSDLRAVHPGDIVRVQTQTGGEARLILLRTAADELGSPE
jgi:hypothetical protein